ncbi:hypothetical protein C1645_833266 [Glomus cerebriforme]|uniref:Uncharacterized protein n=1 Tax=Glomus cerebriforme TaxID=658196 RepID=A0A397SI04_9GLOM|nr:hypothetical protein C1645_833266 [Glomus cerebriforme]
MLRQRVESYNALIKESVKSSTTFFELNIQTQSQLDKKERFEWQEEQANQNPTVGLPNVIEKQERFDDDDVEQERPDDVDDEQERSDDDDEC